MLFLFEIQKKKKKQLLFNKILAPILFFRRKYFLMWETFSYLFQTIFFFHKNEYEREKKYQNFLVLQRIYEKMRENTKEISYGFQYVICLNQRWNDVLDGYITMLIRICILIYALSIFISPRFFINLMFAAE